MSTNWLEFWYDAMVQSHGIALGVDDPVKAKQALYRARKSSCDADLDCLTIRTSPFSPQDELWIVRKEPNDAP